MKPVTEAEGDIHLLLKQKPTFG